MAHGIRPGGWRCYLTNAIKSVGRAEEVKRQPRSDRDWLARVWAPLLAWEIETAKPLLVVPMGENAARYLSQPVVRQAIDSARSELAARVDHYVYVAMRPAGGLRPGHPERIAEYCEEFAKIAQRLRALRSKR
jgi:hypothetical protein